MLSRIQVGSTLFAMLLLVPALAGAQAALGGGVPGENTRGASGEWVPPTGPAARLPNGKPDFNGVWDHPYVNDMSATGRNPKIQKGAGTIPYTDAGLANIKAYDP